MVLVGWGCGGARHAVNSAAQKVDEARAVGADRLAPYEFYVAKARLDEARREGSRESAEKAAQAAAEAVMLADAARGAGAKP